MNCPGLGAASAVAADVLARCLQLIAQPMSRMAKPRACKASSASSSAGAAASPLDLLIRLRSCMEPCNNLDDSIDADQVLGILVEGASNLTKV